MMNPATGYGSQEMCDLYTYDAITRYGHQEFSLDTKLAIQEGWEVGKVFALFTAIITMVFLLTGRDIPFEAYFCVLVIGGIFFFSRFSAALQENRKLYASNRGNP